MELQQCNNCSKNISTCSEIKKRIKKSNRYKTIKIYLNAEDHKRYSDNILFNELNLIEPEIMDGINASIEPSIELCNNLQRKIDIIKENTKLESLINELIDLFIKQQDYFNQGHDLVNIYTDGSMQTIYNNNDHRED